MIHYLILAHNNFDQLEMLVNRIKTKNSKVYIHIDKKVKDFPILNDVYYFGDRESITRGGTKILKVELTGLKEIYKNMKKGDHIVFMSGVCFPIKKIDVIENEINGLGNKSAMSYGLAQQYVKKWITDYWFYDINFHVPFPLNNWMIKNIAKFKKIDKNIKLPVVNFLLSKVISFILPKRKYISENYEIYKGSAWVVLSYEHVKFLLNFMETEKGNRVIKSFKYTNIPDEVFFQTILVNEKKDEVVNKCLWYMIWDEGASCPICLTSDNLKSIYISDKLFARKFDIKKDRNVLDLLNNL